jgi:Ca2+-transporting ATPase
MAKFRESEPVDEKDKHHNVQPRESLTILKKCGYAQGLCQLLCSNPDSGINGDKADIKRRQKKFGKHKIQVPVIDSFYTLAARQFEDPSVIMLIWGATFYLIISLFNKRPLAFVESLTIYTGLILACMISAICDWIKEKQFLELRKEINRDEITVHRGEYGNTVSIPIKKLVVGDVIELNQGDRVPADCILIEEMNITVDQSLYSTNKKNVTFVEKEQSQMYQDENGEWFDNHLDNPDPFMLTNSKIMTGEGKAVVCAVGRNT